MNRIQGKGNRVTTVRVVFTGIKQFGLIPMRKCRQIELHAARNFVGGQCPCDATTDATHP